MSARDRAILTAVAGGSARLAGGALYLDGLCCCDQAAAHRLVRDGFIVGTDDSARLTAAGETALLRSRELIPA